MSDQSPSQYPDIDQDNAGDVDDDSYIAPDEPMGSHAFGLTEAEQRAGETFQQRDRHTVPEVFEDGFTTAPEQVGRLVQPGDEDVDSLDEESNTIASDQGVDDDMSAEEAAMHTTEL